MKITITGYESECHCEHCGRALRHGIRTDFYAVMGADCLRKLTKFDRKRFSQGRPDASFIRTLAKLKERDSAAQLDRMGYHPGVFAFEVMEI